MLLATMQIRRESVEQLLTVVVSESELGFLDFIGRAR
jgi:hypothetical protein